MKIKGITKQLNYSTKLPQLSALFFRKTEKNKKRTEKSAQRKRPAAHTQSAKNKGEPELALRF